MPSDPAADPVAPFRATSSTPETLDDDEHIALPAAPTPKRRTLVAIAFGVTGLLADHGLTVHDHILGDLCLRVVQF